MLICDLIACSGRMFSFELFPPKTQEGVEQLWRVITEELAPLQPTFVSVTYGAGGSTRSRTIELTERIARETDITAMAHLTTVGSTPAELTEIIGELKMSGIDNILALRGDPPRNDPSFVQPEDAFEHAIELVELIDRHPAGDFSVGVAGFPEKHPEAPDIETDVRHLVDKVAAGADFVITQFFFEMRHYERFVSLARSYGLPENVPIIPGIMPVTDLRQIARMAELSGADFPTRLSAKLEAADADGGPDAVWRTGVAEATNLCEELLGIGAPGLHFYTLNRSPATRQIYRNLGIGSQQR